GVAAQVEALWKRNASRPRRHRIAVGSPKGHTWCTWDRKARGLAGKGPIPDVVVGVAGIDESIAPRPGQAIRKGPYVAAVESLRVSVRAKGRGKRHAIACLK